MIDIQFQNVSDSPSYCWPIWPYKSSFAVAKIRCADPHLRDVGRLVAPPPHGSRTCQPAPNAPKILREHVGFLLKCGVERWDLHIEQIASSNLQLHSGNADLRNHDLLLVFFWLVYGLVMFHRKSEKMGTAPVIIPFWDGPSEVTQQRLADGVHSLGIVPLGSIRSPHDHHDIPSGKPKNNRLRTV